MVGLFSNAPELAPRIFTDRAAASGSELTTICLLALAVPFTFSASEQKLL
jgi:hypothetical protein